MGHGFNIEMRQHSLAAGGAELGRLFDEATVLRAGHAYEKATPWRDKRPTL